MVPVAQQQMQTTMAYNTPSSARSGIIMVMDWWEGRRGREATPSTKPSFAMEAALPRLSRHHGRLEIGTCSILNRDTLAMAACISAE